MKKNIPKLGDVIITNSNFQVVENSKVQSKANIYGIVVDISSKNNIPVYGIRIGDDMPWATDLDGKLREKSGFYMFAEEFNIYND